MDSAATFGIWCLLIGFYLFSEVEAKIGDRCTQESECGSPHLACSSATCSPGVCIRNQATNVFATNQSLPFNKYAWLTTHNSFAITGSPSLTGTPIVTFENQEDSVTQQLNNGVRGLMLDMYDFLNDIWLCHSFAGSCFNVTAFQPAINTLKEIETFLSTNPTEIVTIFIEDYVTSPKGLTKVFTDAGLMKYWFPVSKMPKNGEDWPTVSDMIANKFQLVVFTSKSAKESAEGIAYQWNYVVENQYGDAGLKPGTCTNRGESAALSTTTMSLVLQNFFPTNPNSTETCQFNSQPLLQSLNGCYNSAGKRWSNFLAVDFYKRSRGGGSFRAVDVLNGNLLCGCPDVHECQLDVSRGACNKTNDSEFNYDDNDAQQALSSSPPPSGGQIVRNPDGSSSSPTSAFESYFIFLLACFSCLLF